MWELLYETFWDRLEHFCCNLCRDEARAEDLTQEVFLRALQNRSLINSFTERQCKAWLFTTARNLYCDQLRRTAKEEQLLSTFFPEEDNAEPDFALDTVEAASLLALLTPEEAAAVHPALYSGLQCQRDRSAALSPARHGPQPPCPDTPSPQN